EDARVAAAAVRLQKEGLATPIILGTHDSVARAAAEAKVSVNNIEIVDPKTDARAKAYGARCAAGRENMSEAMGVRLIGKPLYFAGMMVSAGDADAPGDRGRADDRRAGERHHAPLQLFPDTRPGLPQGRPARLRVRRLRGECGPRRRGACRHRHRLEPQCRSAP